MRNADEYYKCCICNCIEYIDDMMMFKNDTPSLYSLVCWSCYEDWACECGNKKLFKDDDRCEECQSLIDKLMEGAMDVVKKIDDMFEDAIKEVRGERVAVRDTLMMDNLVDVCPVCRAKNIHLLADMCLECETNPLKEAL